MSKEAWSHLAPEQWQNKIEKFVQFNAKTVNSNAALVGIRLDESAALDAPYVSLRTLLDSGKLFRLDYAEGGAPMSGILKQINEVQADTKVAQDAFPEERQAIHDGMAKAQTTPYSVGTDYVDHRLRQILVPKEDAPGGYVALSPITATSLSVMFFEKETGLVPQHNAAADQDKNGPLRKLKQAQFGIGGANPQNVGGLVKSCMQRPLFVGAPRGGGSAKEAFAVYHKGIALDVHKSGPLRDAVLAYVHFRDAALREDTSITLREREQEETLVARIAATVLDLGAEALNLLQEHADRLPQEQQVVEGTSERWALVSPGCRSAVLRGLIDPALRSLVDNWPRAMADHVVKRMLRPRKEDGPSLLALDSFGRASLQRLLEECFR